MGHKDRDDETSEFRRAMEGVKPLGKGAKAPDDHAPLRKSSPTRSLALSGSALKQYDHRRHAFDLQSHSRVEFFQSSVPYRDRSRLKRGKFDVDATLDLHGKTLDEAHHAFSLFLHQAQNNQCRCVNIIHGKGRDDAPPVLKNAVIQWLPQSPAVLGYCSARSKDGGTGALMVLLKKAFS